MTADRLGELRLRLQENRLADDGHEFKRKGGIGVANVHRRIQMVFGNAYGLTIESKQNEGTIIIMSMPKQYSGELKESP